MVTSGQILDVFLQVESGPASRACDLRCHTISLAPKDPRLGFKLCCHHLEILHTFGTGALHFYFALGPADEVPGPGEQ